MALSDLIEKVRKVTGYPVVSKLEKSLGQDVTSCLQTGSPENPVHVVLISESVVPFQNFQLGVQCLLILLKYKDGRLLEIAPNPVRVTALQNQLTSGHSIQSLEARMVPEMLGVLLEQLNSMPIEIIAMYLMKERAPELEPERQLAAGALAKALIAGAIDPVPMRRIVPQEIYSRNFSMNAALAWALADQGNQFQPLHEFRRLGFSDSGRKLFAALQVLAQDKNVSDFYKLSVDTWAGLLKMQDWYFWDSKPARSKTNV